MAREGKRNIFGPIGVSRTMTAGLRSLGLMLALAAMLLRGVLPVGWMPAADAGAPLVICTGHGALHLGGSRRHAPPEQGPLGCPFASAAHLSLPLAEPPTTARGNLASNVLRVAAARAVLPASNDLAHSPRAPPFAF